MKNKNFFMRSLFHEYLNNGLTSKILMNDSNINNIIFFVIVNDIYQIFDVFLFSFVIRNMILDFELKNSMNIKILLFMINIFDK
jgi:hypothetical protein